MFIRKVTFASVVTLAATALPVIAKDNPFFYTGGIFNSPTTDRRGLELGVTIPIEGKVFDNYVKAGAVLYVANLDDFGEDLFGGFSASWQISASMPVSPYIGAGVYLGRSVTRCNDYEDEYYYGDGYCDDNLIAAAYPEVGVRLKEGKVIVALYGRRYFDTSNTPVSNAYGVSLSLRF